MALCYPRHNYNLYKYVFWIPFPATSVVSFHVSQFQCKHNLLRSPIKRAQSPWASHAYPYIYIKKIYLPYCEHLCSYNVKNNTNRAIFCNNFSQFYHCLKNFSIFYNIYQTKVSNKILRSLIRIPIWRNANNWNRSEFHCRSKQQSLPIKLYVQRQ